MTRLNYEPQRPTPERPVARTLGYAVAAATLIGLTFLMWAVVPGSCELVCYSALMLALAAGSAVAAWWSYQEAR